MVEPKTDAYSKKSIGESTKIVLHMGTLISVLAFTSAASIWVWNIKTNSDEAVSKLGKLEQKIESMQAKVDYLWLVSKSPPIASHHSQESSATP